MDTGMDETLLVRRRRRAVYLAVALGLLGLATYVATFFKVEVWLPALVR